MDDPPHREARLVGHDHLMAKVLELFADPDRMGSGFHGNSNSFEIPKALVYSGRVGSEAASVNHLAVFVELAVMAPDVPKVDTDRYSNPGTSAWVRDEALLMAFHAHSLSRLRKTFSSHFSLFGNYDPPQIKLGQIGTGCNCSRNVTIPSQEDDRWSIAIC
jgi:hypothetical protein